MVDVLLTHSNHLYNDRKQVRKMQPYPPLQTLLAAACLRREGYEVALFDPALEPPEDGFRAGAGAPSAAPGRGVRGQFQFPHQDVPAAQSRTGRLDGAHRARAPECRPSSTAPTPPIAPPNIWTPASPTCWKARWKRPSSKSRGCCSRAATAAGTGSRGIAFLDPQSGAVRHTPRRAPHRRSGFAAHAGLGPDRCRAVPPARGPRPTAISR